jgi:hypothetical protein
MRMLTVFVLMLAVQCAQGQDFVKEILTRTGETAEDGRFCMDLITEIGKNPFAFKNLVPRESIKPLAEVAANAKPTARTANSLSRLGVTAL